MDKDKEIDAEITEIFTEGEVVDAEVEPISVREVQVRGTVPPREISPEAKLIRGAFRVAGLAVGTVVRSAEWAAETTMEVGKQIAQVAVDGNSQAELVDFAGERLRSIARSTLGVDEQVREVVSYVPVGTSQPTAISSGSAGAADLRRRGDELYNLSRDVYYTEDVHPAYSAILDQLAPDETRILKFLAVNEAQPIVDVRTSRPLGIGSELIGEDLTSVPGEAGIRYMDRARSYLINLKRLGLVQVLPEPVMLNRYQVLEVQPIVVHAMKQAGRTCKILRKSLLLTEFGDDFTRMCFTL